MIFLHAWKQWFLISRLIKIKYSPRKVSIASSRHIYSFLQLLKSPQYLNTTPEEVFKNRSNSKENLPYRRKTYISDSICACVCMRACSVYRLLCGAVVQTPRQWFVYWEQEQDSSVRSRKINIWQLAAWSQVTFPYTRIRTSHVCTHTSLRLYTQYTLHCVYVGFPCVVVRRCCVSFVVDVVVVIITQMQAIICRISQNTQLFGPITRDHINRRIVSRPATTKRIVVVVVVEWTNITYIRDENRYSLNIFNSYFSS